MATTQPKPTPEQPSPESPVVPPATDPADLEEAEASVVPTVVTILAIALVLQAATPSFSSLPEVKAAELILDAAEKMGVATYKGALWALGANSAKDHKFKHPRSVSTASQAAEKAGASTLVRYAQSFAQHVSDSGTPLPTSLPNPKELHETYHADIERVSRGVAQSARNAGVYEAARAAGSTHKTWNSRNDRRVRPTHNVLDSHAWPEHTVPIDDDFVSPSGTKLRFPGDPFAPLDEVANCRCWVTFSAPKHGRAYGETFAPAHPPEMQGNPTAPPKNAPPVGVRFA